MPIVDLGPIWKVDSARDRAKIEFSHSLGHKLPLMNGGFRASDMLVCAAFGRLAWSRPLRDVHG